VNRHLLLLVAGLPAVGALVMLAVRHDRVRLLRAVALLTTFAAAAIAVRLSFAFEVRGDEWQFVDSFAIVPSLGLGLLVGVDGLGLVLVMLTAGLTFVALAASWAGAAASPKRYFVSALTLEAAMLGAYMALDVALFTACWIVASLAMCALIATAGERSTSLRRDAVIAIVPGLVLFAGVLLLHVHGRALTGASTFDFRALQGLAIPVAAQQWIFAAVAVGIGAGLALAFRWWLMAAADGRVAAVPALLTALFLKLGTYAFLRLCLPLLPDASRTFAPAIVGIAAVGIVLGAVAAFAQRNWARVLAYASVSHVCFVVVGAFTLTPDGLTGSVVHQVNHGISIAALFLVAGLIAERAHAPSLSAYGGLLNPMPFVAALWLLLTLSLVGVPKLNGFVGAELIAEGVWPVSRVWSIVAATGMGLSGVALVWLFSRTMLGELRSPPGGVLTDLRLSEALVFLPLVALVVGIGIRPAPLLAMVETSVARAILRVSPQFAHEVADCLAQPLPTPEQSGLLEGMVLAAPCPDGGATPPHGEGQKR